LVVEGIFPADVTKLVGIIATASSWWTHSY